MIENFRNASDKLWVKILMGVLIFSFVGWGAANWILGESSIDDAIVRVGGAPVKMADFENARGRAMNAMTRDEQRAVFASRENQLAFSQGILTRRISEIMLDSRADDLGFAVTTRGVADIIRAEPTFQRNGKFDQLQYDVALARAQIDEGAYAASLRSEKLRSMVTASLNAGNVPDFAVQTVYNSRNQTRKIHFTRVAFDDFKISAKPTDAQLADTIAKNPKIIPERRAVSIVTVPAKMAEPDAYDAGYAKMRDIEDAIIGGADFAAAAKQFGGKFEKLSARDADGKFGDIGAAAVFAAESGLESEVIETPNGFVIFRVDEILPQRTVPLSDVRDEMVTIWRRDEQKKAAYLRANELLTDEKFGAAATVSRTAGAPLVVLQT
ncbi:MAG: SurA N-terminal domain-containing protein, partial [Rickettsiales bacterium]|nr:SurA N-terminal domain-containing protein [Rickettsiales bacterium]